jgi:hypothetical protein
MNEAIIGGSTSFANSAATPVANIVAFNNKLTHLFLDVPTAPKVRKNPKSEEEPRYLRLRVRAL